jgi:hypothetical protein
MTVPVRTIIDRRLLLTARIDPEVLAPLLPEPLEPRLVGGWAVGGVCFLRLRDLRPAGIPVVGVVTENVAHRYAVVRQRDDGPVPGVFVPRRDTSSRVASYLGGRMVEGELAFARFEVRDTGSRLAICVEGRGGLRIEVAARVSEEPRSELFASVEEESRFYQDACVAYSPNRRRNVIEAVELTGERWRGTPMSVERFRSSVLEDASCFPPGSWALDSAMLIRHVAATWRPAARLEARGTGVARERS